MVWGHQFVSSGDRLRLPLLLDFPNLLTSPRSWKRSSFEGVVRRLCKPRGETPPVFFVAFSSPPPSLARMPCGPAIFAKYTLTDRPFSPYKFSRLFLNFSRDPLPSSTGRDEAARDLSSLRWPKRDEANFPLPPWAREEQRKLTEGRCRIHWPSLPHFHSPLFEVFFRVPEERAISPSISVRIRLR